jgi:hypothetical protein
LRPRPAIASPPGHRVPRPAIASLAPGPDGAGPSRRGIRHAIDTFRGKAYLVFFTANTITLDIPIENIEAMYETARSCFPGSEKEGPR